MNKKQFFRIFLLLAVVCISGAVNGQNWPSWRGPSEDGTSKETNLPLRWDSVTNVIWKIEVPGLGYSSPIVWNDKIFLTTALTETQERVLLCYSNKKGDLLWKNTVLKAALETKNDNNSYASGTPATDGAMVYLSFLDGQDVVVAAYDFSGKQLWIQKPGKFSSPHGYCCSPVIYKDKLIINGTSKGDSFVAALNKTDGKIIWKIPQDNHTLSYSTPLIKEIAGKTQMIFCGNKEISSYNPDNGKRYWFVSGPSEEFVSSPVYNEKNGLVLVCSSWPDRVLLAIKPDGNGDVTKSNIVWQSKKGAYYVPSPVCTDNNLFTTMTSGEVHCIEVASGNISWVNNLGKQYASPVLAGGLVYMPNDDGVITVIKPGPAFESVSKNPIGERMYASPAISNGKIYIRGFKHLFCIGTMIKP
jgi:outer membrane protein assembly factor BamB